MFVNHPAGSCVSCAAFEQAIPGVVPVVSVGAGASIPLPSDLGSGSWNGSAVADAMDWSPIIEACERRAWLLAEADRGRASFDDLTHGVNCNVNPVYHQGRTEIWKRGCDCGALKTWKQDHGPR